jgi:hypothetical protein
MVFMRRGGTGDTAAWEREAGLWGEPGFDQAQQCILTGAAWADETDEHPDALRQAENASRKP